MNREAVALGTPVWTVFEGRLGAVDEAPHRRRAADAASRAGEVAVELPGAARRGRERIRRDPRVLAGLISLPPLQLGRPDGPVRVSLRRPTARPRPAGPRDLTARQLCRRLPRAHRRPEPAAERLPDGPRRPRPARPPTRPRAARRGDDSAGSRGPGRDEGQRGHGGRAHQHGTSATAAPAREDAEIVPGSGAPAWSSWARRSLPELAVLPFTESQTWGPSATRGTRSARRAARRAARPRRGRRDDPGRPRHRRRRVDPASGGHVGLFGLKASATWSRSARTASTGTASRWPTASPGPC